MYRELNMRNIWYIKVWKVCMALLLIGFTYGQETNEISNASKNVHQNNKNVNVNNSYYTVTPSMIFMSTTEPPPPTKSKRWLICVSAVPTIFIFIVCVIAIAVKNYYEENSGDELDGTSTKKKKKKKINQDIYNVMLEKFKAETDEKRSFTGRKSSQISIEGMESRSPKSLARKHIIIKRLNHKDLEPDGNSSALGQLVQLSTHTFIGSTLIEDMDNDGVNNEWDESSHIEHFIERSKEDLREVRKILPNDVNEALLPEDLEETFRNFGTWEESLL